jgi:hypothetical protein
MFPFGNTQKEKNSSNKQSKDANVGTEWMEKCININFEKASVKKSHLHFLFCARDNL